MNSEHVFDADIDRGWSHWQRARWIAVVLLAIGALVAGSRTDARGDVVDGLLPTTTTAGGGSGTDVGCQLNPSVCILKAVNARVATRHVQANGTVVTKTTPIIVVTPVPIDVDGDNAADINVSVQPSSLDKYTLQINRDNRRLAASDHMNLEAELVLENPDPEPDREQLHAGYRAPDAPDAFATSVTLVNIVPGPANDPEGEKAVNAVVTSDNHANGDALTLVAGMFNGTPTARVHAIEGHVRFPSMPTTPVDLSAGFDEKTKRVSLTTHELVGFEPGYDLAAPSETLDEPDVVQRLSTTVAPINGTVGVSYTQNAQGLTSVRYTATQVVPAITANFVQESPDVLYITANATDVPTQLDLVEPAEGTVRVTAPLAPVGSVEVGVGTSAPPVLGPDTGQYIKIINDGTTESYAGRVLGLKQATIALTDDPGQHTVRSVFADLEVAPTGQDLMSVFFNGADNLVATGTVDSLPAHSTLDLDLDAMTMAWDGHGTSIDSIDLVATSTAPIFANYSQLKAHLEGLPAATVVAIDPTFGSPDIMCTAVRTAGVEVTSSSPIDLVEISASNGGAFVLPPLDLSGAVVTNKDEREVTVGGTKGFAPAVYRLGARARDFERARFFTSCPDTTYYVGATMRSGVFYVLYEDLDRSLQGAIEIPHTADIRLRPPKDGNRGIFSVDTDETTLEDIDLTMHTREPMVDRPGSPDAADANVLRLHLADLPGDLSGTINMTKSKTGIDLDGSQSIGLAEVTLRSSNRNDAVPDFAESGLYVRSLPSGFFAYGKLKGIKELALQTKPDLMVKSASTSAQRFQTDIWLDVPGDDIGWPLTINADVNKLPSFTLTDSNGILSWQPAGGAVIDQIDLDVDYLPDFKSCPPPQPDSEDECPLAAEPGGAMGDGKPRSIQATLKKVPAFSLTHQSPPEGAEGHRILGVDSGANPIGSVFVTVADTANPEPLLSPTLTANGVKVEAFSEGDDPRLTLTARAYDVRRAEIQLPATDQQLNQRIDLDWRAGTRTMRLDLSKDGTRVTSEVKLPSSVQMVIDTDPSEKRIEWTANAPVKTPGTLKFSARDEVGGDLRLKEIPKTFKLCLTGWARNSEEDYSAYYGCGAKTLYHSNFDKIPNNGGPYDIEIPHRVTFTIDTGNGVAALDGTICLKPSWFEVSNDPQPWMGVAGRDVSDQHVWTPVCKHNSTSRLDHDNQSNTARQIRLHRVEVEQARFEFYSGRKWDEDDEEWAQLTAIGLGLRSFYGEIQYQDHKPAEQLVRDPESVVFVDNYSKQMGKGTQPQPTFTCKTGVNCGPSSPYRGELFRIVGDTEPDIPGIEIGNPGLAHCGKYTKLGIWYSIDDNIWESPNAPGLGNVGDHADNIENCNAELWSTPNAAVPVGNTFYDVPDED